MNRCGFFFVCVSKDVDRVFKLAMRIYLIEIGGILKIITIIAKQVNGFMYLQFEHISMGNDVSLPYKEKENRKNEKNLPCFVIIGLEVFVLIHVVLQWDCELCRCTLCTAHSTHVHTYLSHSIDNNGTARNDSVERLCILCHIYILRNASTHPHIHTQTHTIKNDDIMINEEKKTHNNFKWCNFIKQPFPFIPISFLSQFFVSSMFMNPNKKISYNFSSSVCWTCHLFMRQHFLSLCCVSFPMLLICCCCCCCCCSFSHSLRLES